MQASRHRQRTPAYYYRNPRDPFLSVILVAAHHLCWLLIPPNNLLPSLATCTSNTRANTTFDNHQSCRFRLPIYMCIRSRQSHTRELRPRARPIWHRIRNLIHIDTCNFLTGTLRSHRHLKHGVSTLSRRHYCTQR